MVIVTVVAMVIAVACAKLQGWCDQDDNEGEDELEGEWAGREGGE